MVAVFIILAYLIGSIPTAVWIGKAFYNIDVREFGSGNAGATNTFRVLGQKAGIPVLIIDILKGALAVSLAFLSSYVFESDEFVNLQLALGIAALVGHIFPVFGGLLPASKSHFLLIANHFIKKSKLSPISPCLGVVMS